MADEAKSPEATPEVPYLAYVLASVALWVVLVPLSDWILGEFRSLGGSALKGVLMGVFWGLVMHPLERWLRRRAGKKP
jgi:hypothetical protein